MLNVLLDVSWSTVPLWCSRNVKRGSLYCWSSKVYLLIRKEEKQTKKLINVFFFQNRNVEYKTVTDATRIKWNWIIVYIDQQKKI